MCRSTGGTSTTEPIESQEPSVSLPPLCVSSSVSCSSSLRKSVRFENVEIREYDVVLGDNPSCSNGPPISLGWGYDGDQQVHLPLDTFEQYRDGKRRALHEMKVPGYMRHVILREWNVPNREIMKAQIECEIIQKQRFQTLQREQRNLTFNKCVCFK